MSSASSRRSRHPSSSSSHSATHANRQPKWRSPHLAAQPAASISKVFAQPLQGSPLRSAIDSVADIDDAASIISQSDSVRKRERTFSMGSDTAHEQDTSSENAGSAKRPELSAVDSKEEAPQQDNASFKTRDEPPDSETPSDPSPPPPPESPPNSSTPLPISPPASTSTPTPFPSSSDSMEPAAASKSPPKSSSWFSSFSRSLGGSASPEQKSETDVMPMNAQPADTRDAPVSPQSQPVSVSAVTSASLPSSSESAETTRPTSPRTVSGAPSGISSLDDEVPPLRFPLDGVIDVDKEHTIADRLSMSTLSPSTNSVTSLNPSSSSRFMLRIPLLGRPKIPLDQAVAQATADDVRSSKRSEETPASIRAASDESTPAEQPGTPIPQVVVSLPSATNLTAEADADVLNHVTSPTDSTPPATPSVSDAPQPPQPNAEDRAREPAASPIPSSASSQPTPSSSSWWGYLGWSESSTEVNTSVSDPTLNESSESLNERKEEKPSEPLAPETTQLEPAQPASDGDSARRRTASDTPAAPASQAPSSPSKRHSSEVSRAEIKEIHSAEGTEKRPTPSLFSAETARSQGSAWYSPWSWYAASPIVPSSSTLENRASGSEDTLHGKEAQVQEEAQAQGGEAQAQGHVKTESEMVKEQALARDEAKQQEEKVANEAMPEAQGEQSAETKAQAEPASPPVNPIESSISANREGWMSFLMSRAMLMKSITAGEEETKRDESGMEVMDIEEDEPEQTEVPEAKADGSKDAKDEPSKEVKAPAAPPAQAIAIVAGKKKSRSSPTSPSTASSFNSKSPPLPPAQKEREPKKSGPPAPPLTDSDSIKKETAKGTSTRSPSPAPSKASATVPRSGPLNLVLPTWQDIFLSVPRSNVPPPPTPPPTQRGRIGKTLHVLSGVLLGSGKDDDSDRKSLKGKGKERDESKAYLHHGTELPKAFDVLGQALDATSLNETCRVVVIGVAGWSPGAVTRTLAGGLPSSSSKFVNMTCTALEKFEEDHGFKFRKITKIPLEGDGTIERKVAKVHAHLLGSDEWMDDLHTADVIFVATHSQGSIVSAHLLARLLDEGHIVTQKSMDIVTKAAALVAPGGASPNQSARAHTQRICCLALCGIHLGPLRYLRTSSLLQPYIQYFENQAARELFDFQNTESEVSRKYVKALNMVMDHGTKMVYIASLNDQVVPIYSGIFASASHPRILRALYIDGDAYSSSDFLSNLLVLLIRILNSGLSDSGLLTHLSEATAGTLSGVGHSTAYEELSTYSLAVDYLFLTTDGGDANSTLTVEPFNAVDEQNDYEIPWSLRDLIADDRVAHFFAKEFAQLRDAFDDWAPKTSILRDIKRKLQPIQRLSSIKGSAFGSRL